VEEARPVTVVGEDELRKELRDMVIGYFVHKTVKWKEMDEYTKRLKDMNYKEWAICEVVYFVLSEDFMSYDIDCEKFNLLIRELINDGYFTKKNIIYLSPSVLQYHHSHFNAGSLSSFWKVIYSTSEQNHRF